jgi:hypothetical protein
MSAAVLCGCTVLDPEYCTSDSDCIDFYGNAFPPYACHPLRHVCIPLAPGVCVADETCTTSSESHCNLTTDSCEPCTPGDPTDNSCAHLAPQTPVCGNLAGGGTGCVGCLQNLDCPASTPICDGQVCRVCKQHSDCEGPLNCDSGTPCTDSLVCISATDPTPNLAGRCAQNGPSSLGGRVLYVYDAPSGCDATNTVDFVTGIDPGHPICALPGTATTAPANGLTYVRVLDAGAQYRAPFSPGSALMSGQLVYIGAPSLAFKAMNRAQVQFPSSPGFLVTNSGNLTVDGFDLQPGNYGAPTVQCVGTAGFTSLPVFNLRNSVLEGAASTDPGGVPAVDLTNCQAQIVGNFIGATSPQQSTTFSNGAGLSITSTSSSASFLIQNNVIAGNWDEAVNLQGIVGIPPSFTFQFNTVVNNGLKGSGEYGGILCPTVLSGSLQIGYSIIVGNSSPGGTQFSNTSTCTFTNVVVGSDSASASGLIKGMVPTFDSSSYALTAQDCFCAIQATPSAGQTFPATDIAGTPRPQGSSWDVGAYELPASAQCM